MVGTNRVMAMGAQWHLSGLNETAICKEGGALFFTASRWSRSDRKRESSNESMDFFMGIYRVIWGSCHEILMWFTGMKRLILRLQVCLILFSLKWAQDSALLLAIWCSIHVLWVFFGAILPSGDSWSASSILLISILTISPWPMVRILFPGNLVFSMDGLKVKSEPVSPIFNGKNHGFL